MSKSNIFFSLLISFILGIGARSFFEIPEIFSFFGLMVSTALVSIFWKNKTATAAAFLILFFIFGIFLLDRKIEKVTTHEFSEKKIKDIGIIIKEPERKENYQKLTVELQNEKEKTVINTALYPEYSYGDKLSVECDLKIPQNRDESFDYKMYLAKDGIKYVCEKAKIENISENKGNKIYGFILKIKNYLQENISKSIPQPEGSLANGVLFGGSGSMSKQVQENFSKTGMTHIVAVSGYNVTIIAEYLVMLGIFLGLWRKQALWLAILGIFLFVAMIGFPSSAVRAGVMGTVLIWAMKSGRLANSTNAVIFAGAVMLLRWDVGFQLSFLATLGIVQMSPLLENIQFRKNDPAGILEIIFLTISAQIFVLPVIISNFGTVSLVSLFANLLVLPIIPISMLLSFLASIFGIILSPALNIFAWLAYLPLKYEMGVINFLANLSWASISGIKTPIGLICFYYLVIAISIFYLKKKLHAK